jgi:soluble lytic murein transglycosylase
MGAPGSGIFNDTKVTSAVPCLLLKKTIFGYDNFMKRFLFLILFVTSCLPVYRGELNGKDYLKKGKYELDKAKYEDAISSLSAAAKEYPLLADYALLWLSDAYHENGNHEESLNTLHSLIKKYPRSPLIKKSRAREIKEAVELSHENVQKLFESYVKDYSGDADIKYMYAQWLQNNNQKDRAKAIFRDIYIEAGPFAKMAYSELRPSDISSDDMIQRASNLMDAMDFRGAESALRSAMLEDDGRLRTKVLKDLGLALFKQKKYQEAAEVYKKVNDRYWELRSLYRAGEKEAVYSTMNELLQSNDKRMGSILITVASDKRREGAIDEAIHLFENIIERYPSEKEDALWGIGWTYFLAGEYKKASDIFSRLNAAFSNPKYLYWKARSLEKAGGDSEKIYTAIIEKDSDIYSFMSYIRMKESPGQSKTKKYIKPITGTPVISRKINRIEALSDLDFSKEALSELIYTSKNTESIEDIIYICSKMQELGEYKHLVRLALKVPYREEIHRFLYPYAYRETIEYLSKKYSLDPLLALSIIREESRFDPDARSVAGALGLMQLMPHTAYRLDNKLRLGIDNSQDILKVKNNIHVGIYYLSHLTKEFGSYSYAIAAYNAGEEVVRKWLQKGNYKSPDEFIEDIPYSETRNYVKRVLNTFVAYKRISVTGEGIVEIPVEKL